MTGAAAQLRPRSALNVLLSLAVPGSMLMMLGVASHAPLWVSFVLGLPFAFVMLTNYALVHESAHGYLHERPVANTLLGAFAGWHFPMSCRFLTLTHIVHHRCNRTDHEMFDYYYPGDNLFIKYCQWYGILSGLHYMLVPTGSLVAALAPRIFRLPIFTRSRSSGVLFSDFSTRDIWQIRAEVALGAGYWIAVWQLLGLRWEAVAIMYAMAGFHWSTRQYLTHAFTPRDVRNGAIILKAGPLMRAVLLNGNFDLVHHQRPDVPWTHLPRFAPAQVEPVGFWKQYRAMWAGPRPNTEPAPFAEPS